MESSNKFGSWLTEDLKDYKNDLLKERDRSESYTDRVDINRIILIILAELQARERNL